MTEKSKIETAIDHIAHHGSARTPEIAALLGCTEKNVRPMLDAAIRSGYLVTCQVEKHGPGGVRRMSEFRLSAIVSESKVSWSAFRSKKAPGHEISEAVKAQPESPRTQSTQAREPAVPSLADTLNDAICASPLPPVVVQTLPAAPSIFMIGNDRRLRIAASGIELTLSLEETRDLGHLMIGAAPVWNPIARSDSHVQ